MRMRRGLRGPGAATATPEVIRIASVGLAQARPNDEGKGGELRCEGHYALVRNSNNMQ